MAHKKNGFFDLSPKAYCPCCEAMEKKPDPILITRLFYGNHLPREIILGNTKVCDYCGVIHGPLGCPNLNLRPKKLTPKQGSHNGA